MLISLVTIIALISKVYGHSWVRCTDYDAAITGADYNEEDCNGWIRDWSFGDGQIFGGDRGINFQIGIGTGAALCGGNQLSGTAADGYSADYANSDKLARYTSGSTVRVVWPAKNHANYECSQNIPDTAMKLYYNPVPNPTSDLSNNLGSMDLNGWDLVKDWQEGCTAGTDGCGFQNCPKFCENTDKATCFGDFIVPDVDEDGYYTFVWYWIFNGGSSPYISCWEAYIEAGGDTTTPSDESGGSGDTGTVDEYLTQIPYCITGETDGYNADVTSSFVTLHFAEYTASDGITFDVVSVNQDSNGVDFNYTVAFKHADSNILDIVATAGGLCSAWEDYFDSQCSLCDEILTYAIYDYNLFGGANYHGLFTVFAIIMTVIMTISI